jgi:hypothetical protein
VGSNPPGRAKKSLETSTFQGFLLAFSAVPIVQNRAFCAVCGMQNGMQINKKEPRRSGARIIQY